MIKTSIKWLFISLIWLLSIEVFAEKTHGKSVYAYPNPFLDTTNIILSSSITEYTYIIVYDLQNKDSTIIYDGILKNGVQTFPFRPKTSFSSNFRVVVKDTSNSIAYDFKKNANSVEDFSSPNSNYKLIGTYDFLGKVANQQLGYPFIEIWYSKEKNTFLRRKVLKTN